MAIEGAVPAEETAWVVGSRTMKEEDRAHRSYGLFSWLCEIALPRPNPLLHAADHFRIV